jgi:signal transduction histidine kinase
MTSVKFEEHRDLLHESDTCTAIERDITERVQADNEIRRLNRELEERVEERTAQLRESETAVRRKLDSILSPEGDVGNLELAEILDIPAVQTLVEDQYRLTHFPASIHDLKGNLLAGVGWQKICADFHRAHLKACAHCKSSNLEFTAGVPSGGYRIVKCRNNMRNVVTPILIGNRHIGNVFSGQFFFDDEPVDIESFRLQAVRYGFDESEYLAALELVPRISRKKVEAGMRFHKGLAQLLSQISYSRIKLARMKTEAERTNLRLAESIKDMEAFTYTVSHDLRAPLRHMDGFISLLVTRKAAILDDQAKHYIDSSLAASQRMGRLIDDLLQFSRLGQAEMQKAPVDLNSVVEIIVKELEPETRGRSIVWRLAPLPMILADRSMIRQVFENLLVNALKFTQTCATAEIEAGWQPGDDGEQVFFVRDNGAGFDMQYYDKLFHVFQRLHGEQEFEGTGIGLAIARRVVERHGGRIWAEGAVGTGATFYFSLPSERSRNGEVNAPNKTNLVS